MKTLADWLETQLEASGLTQAVASVHAGVSVGTISQMLNQDHIPRIEILFRLAGFFDTPREKILRIAARMPLGDRPPPEGEDDYIVQALLEEFRQVPESGKTSSVQGCVRFCRVDDSSELDQKQPNQSRKGGQS